MNAERAHHAWWQWLAAMAAREERRRHPGAPELASADRTQIPSASLALARFLGGPLGGANGGMS